MNTVKKITLTSAVAFALFAFNACGDDSNSTSASGENGSLSSAVEDDESSSSVNGDTSSSVTPGSSSSVILSDSEESSSSVKGSDTADVSSSSVISDPDRESSSSSVKSSSSSAKSSSSVNSSSSKNQSSSSSVKQSSSSSNLAQSSSSKGNPWGTSAEWGPFNCKANGGCLEFTDDRNGRVYKYLKFDGKKCLNFNDKGKCTDEKDTSIYAMVENLNVGKMVDGSLNQNVDNEIERYCYDNDTLICHYYGGLYQWAEMMQLPSECNNMDCSDRYDPTNHQGICPDNWRLLTYDDFYIILHSDGNTHGIEGLRSTFGFGGYNTTGYSLVGAGMRASPMWGGGFIQLNESAEWYYPNELIVDGKILPAVGFAYDSSQKIGSRDTFGYTKEDGYSVRCVMVNQE